MVLVMLVTVKTVLIILPVVFSQVGRMLNAASAAM